MEYKEDGSRIILRNAPFPNLSIIFAVILGICCFIGALVNPAGTRPIFVITCLGIVGAILLGKLLRSVQTVTIDTSKHTVKIQHLRFLGRRTKLTNLDFSQINHLYYFTGASGRYTANLFFVTHENKQVLAIFGQAHTPDGAQFWGKGKVREQATADILGQKMGKKVEQKTYGYIPL